MALHNAGIDANEMIRNAQAQGEHAQAPGPALIDADEDEIVYKLTFDLPDADLKQLNRYGRISATTFF